MNEKIKAGLEDILNSNGKTCVSLMCDINCPISLKLCKQGPDIRMHYAALFLSNDDDIGFLQTSKSIKNKSNKGDDSMSEGFFDKVYGMGQAVLDAAKRPMVKRGLKTKYQAAYDDAASKILDKEKSLTELRSNFDKFDINNLIEQAQYIDQCKSIQDIIKTEYAIMFGKEMKIVDTED
jgi:hypothetical protein